MNVLLALVALYALTSESQACFLFKWVNVLRDTSTRRNKIYIEESRDQVVITPDPQSQAMTQGEEELQDQRNVLDPHNRVMMQLCDNRELKLRAFIMADENSARKELERTMLESERKMFIEKTKTSLRRVIVAAVQWNNAKTHCYIIEGRSFLS